jgi:hypothetical protein
LSSHSEAWLRRQLWRDTSRREAFCIKSIGVDAPHRTAITTFLCLTALCLSIWSCSPASQVPVLTGTPSTQGTQNWTKLQGHYVSLEVPSDWNPVMNDTGTGPLQDSWQLEVPGSLHASVSFSAATLNRFTPPEELLISEASTMIGGKPGYKWVRLIEMGEAQVAYEYMTTGPAGQGSFGIHILMPGEDRVIEQLLDQVVLTIIFLDDDTLPQ